MRPGGSPFGRTKIRGTFNSALGYRSPIVYEQETEAEPPIETLLSQAP